MLNLETAINQAKNMFVAVDTESDIEGIHVDTQLRLLLHTEKWTAQQLVFFHAWMKKMDVAKTQYLTYNSQWRPGPEKKAISHDHRQLSILMALRYLQSSDCLAAHPGQTLKTINVLFKMLEHEPVVFALRRSELHEYLQRALTAVQYQTCAETPQVTADGTEDQTLPVTVLFSEGPIARAYLEAIAALGMKVSKIIRLVSSVDLVSKKPVGGILPKTMKVNYAANKQYKQMFYWPNLYQSKQAQEVSMIQEQVHTKLGFALNNLQAGIQNKDLNQYTDVVETLFVTGLKDPQVQVCLQQQANELFLYTGGGIVPDALLNIKNKKLIHVHPGYLPEIRGADCVLWSQALHQKMSASAFFLAPGIDVGDVLYPCWLTQIQLKFPKEISSRVKYRLIYGYLDPWVRAFVLQQLILHSKGLRHLAAKPQHEDSGMTYHFMHEQLKQMAYNSFE